MQPTLLDLAHTIKAEFDQLNLPNLRAEVAETSYGIVINYTLNIPEIIDLPELSYSCKVEHYSTQQALMTNALSNITYLIRPHLLIHLPLEISIFPIWDNFTEDKLLKMDFKFLIAITDNSNPLRKVPSLHDQALTDYKSLWHEGEINASIIPANYSVTISACNQKVTKLISKPAKLSDVAAAIMAALTTRINTAKL